MTSCWYEPILISQKDVLTKGTADQIETRNKAWEEVCKK